MGSRQPTRVLVIEDELLLALSIASQVEKFGWQVVGPAGRIAEAMRLARDEAFNAAVLDLNLHGDTTFGVAKILSERAIPFIFLTGYDPAAVPREYASVPILEKPFTDAELAARLQPMLGAGGIASDGVLQTGGRGT
jgi:DNA-binding response OmpR family regulator